LTRSHLSDFGHRHSIWRNTGCTGDDVGVDVSILELLVEARRDDRLPALIDYGNCDKITEAREFGSSRRLSATTYERQGYEPGHHDSNSRNKRTDENDSHNNGRIFHVDAPSTQ
jgi:hypothetical protein